MATQAKTANKTSGGKPPEPKKTASTAVATRRSSEVAEYSAEVAALMDEDAGFGVSTRPEDVGIPFLAILQDLSPQVKKRDEKYIDGAEVGMIINNQSKEIYAGEDGIYFIPCFFKSCLVEWVPRDKGGGWVAEYPDGDPILRKTTRPDRKKAPVREDNGNHIVQTKYYFGLHVKPDGNYEACVVGLSSSGLKVSREWMRIIKANKTPSGNIAAAYSNVYHLRTKLAKNNAGQEYFTWDITKARPVETEEYLAGRQLGSECARGAVQVSRPDETAVGASDEEEVL